MRFPIGIAIGFALGIGASWVYGVVRAVCRVDWREAR